MISRLRHFLQDWFISLGQYWGAYIVATYTTIIRVLYIYYEPASSALSEMLLSCGFTFPLMVTSSLISQIVWKKNYWNMIWYVIVWLMGIWFYSYIHYLGVFNDDYSGMEQHRIFVVLSYVIARWSLLWWIAYSTYKTSLQTRWWLKELLINMLIAIVSSLILRWGLSASIGSVDYLFDIDIYYKRYQYIGVISFCVVGVSIVLTNLATTRQVDDYPKILRFFGLYIFLPLAIIYAAILISYGAKIVITQTWPKWLISRMVIWYTIRCTTVYFLTYPLQNLTWIKKIHTWYFVSILVFLPLLIWAIRQRIAQYGITESRYLIMMVVLWIGLVGIWWLIRRSKSWLLMIGWLLILAISSVYTPWSASSVSLTNQKLRLEQLLTDNGFWDGNKLIVQEKEVNELSNETKADLAQAWSIVEYLNKSFWSKSLWYLYANSDTWFQELLYNKNSWNSSQMFIRKLWITWELPWIYNRDTLGESRWEPFNIYRQTIKIDIISIKDYQYMIKLYSYEWKPQESINNRKDNLQVNTQWENNTIISITPNQGKKVVIDLDSLGSKLYNLSKKELNIEDYQLDFDWYSIIFTSINWERKWETYKIIWYDIIVLLK